MATRWRACTCLCRAARLTRFRVRSSSAIVSVFGGGLRRRTSQADLRRTAEQTPRREARPTRQSLVAKPAVGRWSTSAPLLIPPSSMPFHVPRCHGSPDSPAGVWGNYGNQVATSTGLAENHPSGLSYAATPSANNPRCVAIFINDLFDFFWLYAVAGNVLTVVVVLLRLQLPESHSLRLPQRTASFDSSNVAINRRRVFLRRPS